MKEDLTKERDDLLTEIVKGRDNLSEAQNRLGKLEQDQQESQQRIQEVRHRMIYLICHTS